MSNQISLLYDIMSLRFLFKKKSYYALYIYTLFVLIYKFILNKRSIYIF